ncbi:MAG: hypothetical protein RIQ68_1468 [Pseudomonadota bacterium]|jgi:hypothetical protein
MSADEDRNFLARWSQRKREVAKQAAAQPVAPASEAAVPAVPEEEDFDLSLLPKLEELTPSTDLTLFFKKGVPEVLRNAALRKMWTLDPAIRDYRSEALDYAYDWNAPGGVPGGGDLPADFDSREMVARIFGDEPTDENVIGNVAVQQAPDVGGEKPFAKPDESRTGSVETQKHEDHQEFSKPVGTLADDEAPLKKRRHGKALPSA